MGGLESPGTVSVSRNGEPQRIQDIIADLGRFETDGLPVI